MSATCKSCQAPILWATTVRGKPLPLDLEPALGGNIFLEHGVATVLTRTEIRERDELEDGCLYRTHFATCPQANEHRQ